MSTQPNRDRRTQAERRNAPSRRRHAETRRVYIELCHSVLRIALVVESDSEELPSLTARTVRWRHDAPDLMSDQGKAELAAALRNVVANDRLAGCSVSLAISSTLCVNRATTGASTRVEQDITDLESRSQLYLALGPGAKTTAVGRKQIDARHEHALVTVTNERTLALLVSAAESAGLVVEAVESALVALSRLQGQLFPEEHEAVILAQLDEEHFEIGVSREGQLLLEYRPSIDTTVAQLGEVVDSHHERLQRFCRRQYGVGQMNLEQLWLVGDADEVRATNAETKNNLKCGVLPLTGLSKIWQVEPGHEIKAEMGAALGAALRERCLDSGVSPNLMDQIHAQAKAPIRPFLIRAAAPIAATLLIAAGLWAFNLEQEVELATLRRRVDQLKPEKLRGERLAKQLIDTATEIQHLAHLEERTPKRDLCPLFERVGQCLPEDVWLKEFRLNESDSVNVAGASYTEGGVYDFVRYVSKAPIVREVALLGTGVDQTPQGPATSFDIDIELKPAPLAVKEKEDG